MNRSRSIFFGVIAALGAMIVELAVSIFFRGFDPESGIGASFISIIFIEESFKFLLIREMSQKTVSDIFSGSLFFGLGFAFTEIVLNILNYPDLSVRYLIIYANLILIHSATCLLYGAHFKSRPSSGVFKGTAVFTGGILLHFMFNAAITSGADYVYTGCSALFFILFMLFKFGK